MICPGGFEKRSQLSQEGDRKRFPVGGIAEEEHGGERFAMHLVGLEQRHNLRCDPLRLCRSPSGKIGLGKVEGD